MDPPHGRIVFRYGFPVLSCQNNLNGRPSGVINCVQFDVKHAVESGGLNRPRGAHGGTTWDNFVVAELLCSSRGMGHQIRIARQIVMPGAVESIAGHGERRAYHRRSGSTW